MTRIPIKLPDGYVLALNDKVVKRTPIILTHISWEEFYESLYKLLQYAAKNIYFKYESVCKARCLDVDDLFQEAQLVAVDCWIKYHTKDTEDLMAMTRSSIWRHLRDIVHKKAYVQVDIDNLSQTDEPYEEPNYDEEIDTQIKLVEIKKLLQNEPTSLRILQEYISPNEITLACMHKDMQDKMAQVEKGLLPPNLNPKSLKITKAIVKRSLRIQGIYDFDNAFKTLKQTIRKVFSR